MRIIPIEPLDERAFSAFGSLLVAPDDGPRQDRATPIENLRARASANLALVRSEPFAGLMPLTRMERHPHSSQAFLPLAVGSYLVVVAPDRDGRPDEAAIRAFRVPGRAGINYRAGAWHAHLMTTSAPGTFAMLVHEDGTAEDCVFAPIAPVTVGPARP